MRNCIAISTTLWNISAVRAWTGLSGDQYSKEKKSTGLDTDFMRISSLLLCLLLTSCAFFPPGPSSNDADAANRVANDFARSRLVADDFVAAMIQLPQLAPSGTTLSTDIPESRFGQLLIHSMQKAGYEFRVQGSNPDPQATSRSLAYFVSRKPETTKSVPSLMGVYDFLIEAGSVKLKRSYKVDTDGIWPESSMYVLGADASGLQLDTRLFDRQQRKTEQPSGALLASTSNNVLPQRRSPYTSPTRRVSAEPLTPSVSSVRPVGKTSVDKTAAQSNVSITKLPVKRNIYDTDRSNYAEVLAQYRTVTRKVLIFANDSMIMGDANKRIASQLADNFDSETDIISLIGCSHGPTSLRNGNALLANGRASRVKEEFLIAGIDAELVLDEGCWAGIAHDKMPARGVIVTHKRRRG